MGQNEARIKLSVDTSQAQQQVKNLGRQVSEIGSGPSPNVREAMGEGSPSGSGTAEDSVNSQRKLVNSLEDYLSGVEKSNEKMIAALDSIEQYLRGGAGGGNGTGNGGNGNGSKTKGSGDDDLMGKLSKTLFSMQAISSAISATLNYVKNGAAAAQTNEMAAYKAYGTIGLYDNYSTARNETSQLGLPLGYNASESIAVANGIVSGTGSGTQEEVQSDISAILRAARGLNVDENALTSTAAGFYQTGTYNRGQMNQFTNLLGTLIEESGMVGREDETLEVLNAIHTSLKENLTNITESQYESTLGLYSLMAEYNSNYQGAKGSSILENLNSFITGDSTGLNVALGWGTQYQGWGGYWQLAQQKEQGLGNPDNLKSILETFNAYSSYDIGSEEYMGQLYKYLNSSFGADTQFTQFIADNMDTILSGNYSSDFSKALAEAAGTEMIDQNVTDYEDTSLATKNQYDAEKANAAEETSSSIENKFGWFQNWYNGLPSGVQSALSIGGGLAESLGTGAAAYGGFKGLKWIGGKLFGAGTTGAGAGAGAGGAGLGASGAGAGAGAGAAGFWSSIQSGLTTAGAYATQGLSSASQFLASNPALTQWLGVYGPAIPDAINGWGQVFDDIGDEIHANTNEEYGAYKDWSDSKYNSYYSQGQWSSILEDEFDSLQEAIQNGTYSDWVDSHVGDNYMVNPDTGKTTDYDLLLGRLATVILNDSSAKYSTESSITSAEDAKEWYNNLSKESLQSLLTHSSLSDAVQSVYDAEDAKKDAVAKAGNYYSDWEARYASPFYGSEGMFSYDIGDYTDEDLETLRNSMIKDYVENGKINVSDYFGSYMYQGGDYAKEVNSVLQDLFGKDTGYSSNFVKEMFSNQYKTSNALNSGIEDILDDYVGEYDEIIADSETATEDIQTLTESVDELNTTVEDMRDWLEQNGYEGTAVLSDKGVQQAYDQANSPASLFGTNSTKALTPFSFWNLLGGSHATGNDYVPYDGYIAELHKGEAVLDKVSADEYRGGSTGENSHNTLEIRVTGAIEGMTDENQAQITKAVIAQIQQQANLSSMMSHLGNGTVRFAN